MINDAAVLAKLREALSRLASAERERALAWAWSGSGLLDATERRAARMEAEREVDNARERVRRARDAVLATGAGEKAWGGH